MFVRHGSVFGISEILLGLCGRSGENCMIHAMKDSIFLKSMTTNEKKLVHAGEYLTQFNENYQKVKSVNNIGMLLDSKELLG